MVAEVYIVLYPFVQGLSKMERRFVSYERWSKVWDDGDFYGLVSERALVDVRFVISRNWYVLKTHLMFENHLFNENTLTFLDV